MSHENPKPLSPEELKLQKSRTISDAELLKEGAEYESSGVGNPELRATEKQKRELHQEMVEEIKKKLLEEKDPERFSDTYWEFIKRGGGGIDSKGQVIASEESIESARRKMERDLLERDVPSSIEAIRTKDRSSQEYIDAYRNLNEVLRRTPQMRYYGVPADVCESLDKENKTRGEIAYERLNTMPDSEYLLLLPTLLKPGTLESLKDVTSESNSNCCRIAKGHPEFACVRAVADDIVGENEHFVGIGCDEGKRPHQLMLALSGGRKILTFSPDELGYSYPSFKAPFSDLIRKILSEQFTKIAKEEGLSDEQTAMLLKQAE
jgi:hypothetical protein